MRSVNRADHRVRRRDFNAHQLRHRFSDQACLVVPAFQFPFSVQRHRNDQVRRWKIGDRQAHWPTELLCAGEFISIFEQLHAALKPTFVRPKRTSRRNRAIQLTAVTW